MNQKKEPPNPPEPPELRKATFIKKSEDENFKNAEWFFSTITQQESIEILKEKGLNKSFLVRETEQ